MRSHPMHPLSYPTGKYRDVFLKKVTENIFKVLSFQLLIVEFLGIGLWFEISDILETLKIPTYKTLEWKKKQKKPNNKKQIYGTKVWENKYENDSLPIVFFLNWKYQRMWSATMLTNSYGYQWQMNTFLEKWSQITFQTNAKYMKEKQFCNWKFVFLQKGRIC